MEWLEVLVRIEGGEDHHTEFKRGPDLKDIGRAICAFANSQGGVVILGIDNSGTIVGVADAAEAVQERLTSFLQSGCSSPVYARMGRHQDPSGWVHWIEVPRHRGYEPLRFGGRVWVRRERSSVEPSPAELQDLYNRGLLHEDIPLVPEKALREAIVNAVAHRDYAITGSKVVFEVFADRIDITSPGTLPNHMTPESVRAGGHPRSRNELMANFMLVRGVMEQRGRGWPVMRRAMREFNGTDAELMQDKGGRFVRVTFRLESER